MSDAHLEQGMSVAAVDAPWAGPCVHVTCVACHAAKVRFSRHHDVLRAVGLLHIFEVCRRLAKGGHALWFK